MIHDTYGLRQTLKAFDEGKKHRSVGKWSMGVGGYDLAFALCFEGRTVIEGIQGGRHLGIPENSISLVNVGFDDPYDFDRACEIISEVLPYTRK